MMILKQCNLSDVFKENIEDFKGPLVYQILNTVNNKCYIGTTLNSLLDRFCYNDWFYQSHRTRYNSGENSHLYNSMRYYGLDKFVVNILFYSIDSSEIYKKESEFIEICDSYNNGYNRSKDGYFYRSEFTVMNDSTRFIHVKKSDVEYMKSLGWKLGFGNLGWSSKESREKAIKTMRDNNLGFYNSEIQSELALRGCMLGVETHRKNKTNFFSSEWQSIQGSKGGARCVELKSGIHNPEIRKRVNETLKLEKRGIYAKSTRDKIIETQSTLKVGFWSPETQKLGAFSRWYNRRVKIIEKAISKYGILTQDTYIKCSDLFRTDYLVNIFSYSPELKVRYLNAYKE